MPKKFQNRKRVNKQTGIIAKQFDVLLQQNLHLMQEFEKLKRRFSQKQQNSDQRINIYNQTGGKKRDPRSFQQNDIGFRDDTYGGYPRPQLPKSINPIEQIINEALFGGGPPPDKIVIRITDPHKKPNLDELLRKKTKEETEKTEPEVLDEDYEEFETEIKSIDDLISLGEMKVNTKSTKKSCLDHQILANLVTPLKKLKNMVGMTEVKKNICQQIVYFLQKFEKANDTMLHTIIEGPPGVGKTELGRILGEIYLNMGLIKGNKFKIVKRSDLIDRYLGHTAMKTQEVIDDCDGGVLFIDEAYSLGNDEKQDIFSKECLDTLNMNLSENKSKFVCIIAGYADALENCFFAYNQGLKRRFPFKYTINKYDAVELKDIFVKKIETIKWKISDELPLEKLTAFFKENINEFPNFGGDIETLVFKCKISHANRTFGKHPKLRRILTLTDIQKGFDMFKVHKNESDKTMSLNAQMMYI